MNIYKKLLNNSLIFAVGSMGTKMVIFLLLPLYTHYLTPSEYGLVDLFSITITLIIPIITLGIINGTLRYVMDKNYDNEAVLINSLIVIALGIIALILIYPLVQIIFSENDFIVYFFLLLIVQTISSLVTQYVRAKGMIRLFALSGIFTAVFLLIGNLVFLMIFNLSIEGYFLAAIISYMLTIAIVFFAGRISNDINFRKINSKLIKDMLFYSIPLIPNTLMWWVMGVSDRFMVTYFLGLSYAGFYAVAVKIPSILNVLNSIFFQAWQMSAIEEADSKGKSIFYTNVFNVFSIAMLIFTSVILIFLKPIMGIMVAESFYESWKYVPFLLLGTVFSSFSAFLGTNYIAAKKTSGVFKTSVIGAVINIVINIILIPLIGINGAALGTMFSFFIVWLLRIRDTKQFVDIKINKIKLSSTFLIILIQILILYSNINSEYVFQGLMLITIILLNLKEIKILIKKITNLILLKK